MYRRFVPTLFVALLAAALCQPVTAGVAADCDFLFPWITNNDRFGADLVFTNLGDNETRVRLTAKRADGNQEQVEFDIDRLEQVVFSSAELFPNLGNGAGYSVYALTANSSDRVDAAFRVNGKDSCSQSSPAQANVARPSDAGNLLFFKYMPQEDGGSAAPVIVNTGSSSANVTVHAYRFDGKLGTAAVTIPADLPYAATIASLFPDNHDDLYLVVESDQPIVGLSFAFNQLGEPSMANAVTLSAMPASDDDNGLTGWDAILAKFTGNVQAFVDGDRIVVRTDSVPNHGSPYFGTGDARYEQPHAGMVVNPNHIAEQNLEFRIPANPTVTASGGETRLGPIGVALNGVSFFNQYAGRTATGWQALDNEIATFDSHNGHPTGTHLYHYHFEPVFLTAADKAALIGVMMDGFPIYGPNDPDGAPAVDLDECNGHTHATAEFPEGIYHYHATTEYPYLVGCYRGQSGTVTF